MAFLDPNREKVRFFWMIDSIPYGVTIRQSNYIHAKLPWAWHYGCPECGEVWAKCLPVPSTPGNPSPKIHHSFLHVPCPSCGVTGSINPSIETLHELPYEMLVRELFIACEYPDLYQIQSRQLKRNS